MHANNYFHSCHLLFSWLPSNFHVLSCASKCRCCETTCHWEHRSIIKWKTSSDVRWKSASCRCCLPEKKTLKALLTKIIWSKSFNIPKSVCGFSFLSIVMMNKPKNQTVNNQIWWGRRLIHRIEKCIDIRFDMTSFRVDEWLSRTRCYWLIFNTFVLIFGWC